MKTAISGTKNMDGTSTRLDIAEKINKLKDVAGGTIQNETEKSKTEKKTQKKHTASYVESTKHL